MAALPTPGADNNTWATKLNDYLNTSHNADGSLKDGIVTPAKLSQAYATVTQYNQLGSRVGVVESLINVATPVVVSPISYSLLTHNSVRLTFTTNIVATASVLYGNGSAIDNIPPYNYPAEQVATTTDGLTHTVDIIGLTPATAFAYRAYALTANSEAYSAESTLTTAAAPAVTPTISGALASKTITTIRLDWLTDIASDSTLEVRTTAGPGAWVPIIVYEPVTTHQVTASGLTANTSYDWRISSRSTTGLLSSYTSGTITTDAAASSTVFVADFSTDDTAKFVRQISSPPAGTATTAVTGGEATVTLSTTGGTGNGHITTSAQDAANKEIIFNVTKTYLVGGGPSTRARVTKRGDTTQEFGFLVDNNNIAAFWRRDGVETFGTFRAFSSTNDLHFRVRTDIAGTGTLIFDTATDEAFTTNVTALETVNFATAVNSTAWNLNSSDYLFTAGSYTTANYAAYGPAKLSKVLVKTLGVYVPPAPSPTFPTAIVPNWTPLFEEPFDTIVPKGAFPGTVYGGRWDAYPPTYKDTSKNGTYRSDKINSVVLTEDGNTALEYDFGYYEGQYMVAAPLPRTGYQSSFRISFRWRSLNVAPRYKVAFLTWPENDTNWPDDGEGDFLEGGLDGPVEWYMHRQDATSGGDQDHGQSSVQMSGTGWHITTVEWIGGTSWKVFLDGVQVGSTITSRVMNTRMRISMQLETGIGTGAPATTTKGKFQIDWFKVWRYTPGTP